MSTKTDFNEYERGITNTKIHAFMDALEDLATHVERTLIKVERKRKPAGWSDSRFKRHQRQMQALRALSEKLDEVETEEIEAA